MARQQSVQLSTTGQIHGVCEICRRLFDHYGNCSFQDSNDVYAQWRWYQRYMEHSKSGCLSRLNGGDLRQKRKIGLSVRTELKYDLGRILLERTKSSDSRLLVYH